MKVKIRIRGDLEAVEAACKILGKVFSIDALTPIISSSPEAGVHRFLDISFEKGENR
ncbi:hypothetical protein MUP77_24505 [Candidatus Bathyarchaeota archaeon]|nr:hypothetical protein [Candidatus Bathyarchaeota archaeon]